LAAERLHESAEKHDRGLFPRAERSEVGSVESTELCEDVDIVVAQLKRIVRSASLEFALQVGAIIIHHCYDDDPNAWRSRGPKVASFRRLARHPDLPLSPGTLYRCVAMFELCERLNVASRWGHLGASHVRLVLGLPPSTQERILSVANAQRWSVKKLQEEVLQQQASRLTVGGRRAESPFNKSLRDIAKSLEAHRGAMGEQNCASPEEVEQSLRLIAEAERCLEQVRLALADFGVDPE
jgi:hypothetical protein